MKNSLVLILILTAFSGCQHFKSNNDATIPENTGLNPNAFSTTLSDRQLWLEQMDKMAGPIITNLANNNLKKNMPVELSDPERETEIRTKSSYLEAFGRRYVGHKSLAESGRR